MRNFDPAYYTPHSLKQNIKIALVDDHQLFREGLAQLISGFPGVKIVIEAENGRDLISQLMIEEVDVILMDLYMPEMNGLEATLKIHQIFPEIKIIALSMNDGKKFILEMIKNGASGYLSKNSEPEELQEAIHAVMEKDFYFNNHVTEALLKGWRNKKRAKVDLCNDQLTKREREVLIMICKQFTTAEIAKKLYLSPRTVENYRHRLLEKLGVRNTAGIVIYAIENGFIDVDLTQGGFGN